MERTQTRYQRWLPALLLLLAIATLRPAAAQTSGPLYYAEAPGIFTEARADHLRRALREAESASAAALIIILDGQGGVLQAARPLAAEIAAASVPVVVYVAPGRSSGPVGALLLSAAHISALGPGSSFGSAVPLVEVDTALSQQTRDLVLDSVVDQLRGWNQAQGRNTGWIDQAVRSGALLDNQQAMALAPPAVDLVAASAEQLPTLIDNRTVRLANGQNATIAIGNRPITPFPPSPWESGQLLFADPNLVFALLILGVLLICLEFATPGTSLFAGAGVLLLLGALLGLLQLPFHAWALAILLLGLACIGAEFFVPSHGGLALAGIVLLVFAGLNLIDSTQAPGVTIAWWAITALGAGLALLIAVGVSMALRVRARPISAGQESLIGMIAEVRQPLTPEGMVHVNGELWRAICDDGEAQVGERVRVTAIHQLQLVVHRLEA